MAPGGVAYKLTVFLAHPRRDLVNCRIGASRRAVQWLRSLQPTPALGLRWLSYSRPPSLRCQNGGDPLGSLPFNLQAVCLSCASSQGMPRCGPLELLSMCTCYPCGMLLHPFSPFFVCAQCTSHTFRCSFLESHCIALVPIWDMIALDSTLESLRYLTIINLNQLAHRNARNCCGTVQPPRRGDFTPPCHLDCNDATGPLYI